MNLIDSLICRSASGEVEHVLSSQLLADRSSLCEWGDCDLTFEATLIRHEMPRSGPASLTSKFAKT